MNAQICGGPCIYRNYQKYQTLDDRAPRRRKKRSLWTCACSKHSSLLQIGDDLARSLRPAQRTGVSDVNMLHNLRNAIIVNLETVYTDQRLSDTDLLLYFIGRKG